VDEQTLAEWVKYSDAIKSAATKELEGLEDIVKDWGADDIQLAYMAARSYLRAFHNRFERMTMELFTKACEVIRNQESVYVDRRAMQLILEQPVRYMGKTCPPEHAVWDLAWNELDLRVELESMTEDDIFTAQTAAKAILDESDNVLYWLEARHLLEETEEEPVFIDEE